MPLPLMVIAGLASAAASAYAANQQKRGQAEAARGAAAAGQAGRAGAATPMPTQTSSNAALASRDFASRDSSSPIAPAASPLTPGNSFAALPGPSPLTNTGPAGGFKPVGQDPMTDGQWLPQAGQATGALSGGGGGGAATGLGYAQAALGAGQTLHDLFAKDGTPPAGAGYGGRGGVNIGPSMRLGDLYGQARRRYY